MKKITRSSIPARHRIRAGFTLIEMIFVLAIISILVGMGVYSLKNVLGDANDGAVMADIRNLETNLIRYRTMAMGFPTEKQGLKALVERPAGSGAPKRWKALLGPEAIMDPWGNPYAYRNPAKFADGDYDIWSLGKDGQDGTEDDIGNW